MGIFSSLFGDLRVLLNLALAPFKASSGTHKERLESFYGDQAGAYDDFRKRLLKGREELVAEVAEQHGTGGIWVDMGGGTGANLEMLGDTAVMSFAKIYIVDMCGPLLEVAKKRCEEHGWHNVVLVEDDATTWVPDEGYGQIDVITFSYSLTMIPDWFAAIDHATKLLAPGGIFGVVDFYISRKYPAEGNKFHTWFQRLLWPTWFQIDDVRLSSEHMPYMSRRFAKLHLVEMLVSLPYMGLLHFLGLPKVPVYRFIGRRQEEEALEDASDGPLLAAPPKKFAHKKGK